MTEPKTNLEKLPAATRERLDDLTRALQGALGDDLVSLVVHGSAVRGGFRDRESDVDVVVVLAKAPRERLDAIANAVALARNAARIECMILVESEIGRAADVFPLFYSDIQRVHAVLAGKDPFAGLAISRQHLRLRIEQELREAQIRLRRAVTDATGDDDLVAGALHRKVRQIRAPLRALLAMRGEECEDDLAHVLEAAAKAYAVDTKPLTHVREAPAEAYATLTRLLDLAIEDVDARDRGGDEG
jgi:predicted nucleotidyltransferase